MQTGGSLVLLTLQCSLKIIKFHLSENCSAFFSPIGTWRSFGRDLEAVLWQGETLIYTVKLLQKSRATSRRVFHINEMSTKQKEKCNTANLFFISGLAHLLFHDVVLHLPERKASGLFQFSVNFHKL